MHRRLAVVIATGQQQTASVTLTLMELKAGATGTDISKTKVALGSLLNLLPEFKTTLTMQNAGTEATLAYTVTNLGASLVTPKQVADKLAEFINTKTPAVISALAALGTVKMGASGCFTKSTDVKTVVDAVIPVTTAATSAPTTPATVAPALTAAPGQTLAPTAAPTSAPGQTLAPTQLPTAAATAAPGQTLAPTSAPTAAPGQTLAPTAAPTAAPVTTTGNFELKMTKDEANKLANDPKATEALAAALKKTIGADAISVTITAIYVDGVKVLGTRRLADSTIKVEWAVVSAKAIAPEAIVAETLKTNVEAEAKAVGVTVVITEAPALVVVPAPTTAPTGATPTPSAIDASGSASTSIHPLAAPLAAMAAVLAQIFA